MCGIAGWIDYRHDLTNEHRILGEMKQSLVNRGPDAGGTYMAKHAALGHRRLTV